MINIFMVYNDEELLCIYKGVRYNIIYIFLGQNK